jgi:hypothetical protein
MLEALLVGEQESYVTVAAIVLHELIVTSLQHQPSATDHPVEVEGRFEDRRLHLRVCGPNDGFRSADRPPKQIGGWGMLLVNALASRWGIDQGSHTWMWAEIVFPAAVPELRQVDEAWDHEQPA